MRDGTDWLFETDTPLGFSVHTTTEYWDYITTVKHPTLRGRLDLVVQTLRDPDQIRRSRSDENVFLFYRTFDNIGLICSVAKQEGIGGFLITAYQSDTIKRGVLLWTK